MPLPHQSEDLGDTPSSESTEGRGSWKRETRGGGKTRGRDSGVQGEGRASGGKRFRGAGTGDGRASGERRAVESRRSKGPRGSGARDGQGEEGTGQVTGPLPQDLRPARPQTYVPRPQRTMGQQRPVATVWSADLCLRRDKRPSPVPRVPLTPLRPPLPTPILKSPSPTVSVEVDEVHPLSKLSHRYPLQQGDDRGAAGG